MVVALAPLAFPTHLCYDRVLWIPTVTPARRTSSPVDEEIRVSPSPPPTVSPSARLGGITVRSLLLGMLLAVPNTYWITVVEVRWYTLDGTSLPLFITPIFFLFCLVLMNLAVRRVAPARADKLAFKQSELITVYIVLVVGTVLAGHDMYQNMFGSIGHAAYKATPENHWKTLFFPFLPKFWLVSDPVSLKAYYLGNVNPYDPRYWGPFVGPLLYWALFISTLILICGCLNILVKSQWTDNERLSFPIVQLPMAMTGETSMLSGSAGASFFSNRAMWTGFIAAALIDALNGFHNLYPSLPYSPEIIKQYNIGQFFTSRPWSAVSDTNLAMYPFAIGLAFFVPLDLSFSCWFFFVARKGFQVFGSVTGMDGPGGAGFPFFEQQASGAWVAWGLTIVWALRKQIASTWRSAFVNKNRNDGTADGITDSLRNQYRGAYIGIGLGVVSLAIFSREDRACALGCRPILYTLLPVGVDNYSSKGRTGNAA